MKDTKGKKGATTVAKRDVKEKTRKVEDKDIKKRKSVAKEPRAKKSKAAKKATKAAKDPNAPQATTNSFLYLPKRIRKTFKEEHPDVKGVTMVGKAGGEKWKDMSDAEKQPYVSKAAQKKTEYDKTLAAYKQKQDDDDEAEAEESDKSKSEINDDDEDEDEDEDLED